MVNLFFQEKNVSLALKTNGIESIEILCVKQNGIVNCEGDEKPMHMNSFMAHVCTKLRNKVPLSKGKWYCYNGENKGDQKII